LQSCFPEKFSVPRQGNILELTRARIVLNIDASTLDGLENFDYIWIIYVFHLNQNFKKTKIAPPKYDGGQKLGIFATRTPHRTNPIGLTLAKILKIEGNQILVSGVDMINETPILDIKPYHHLESLDINKIKYPSWIKDQTTEDSLKNNVIFSDIAFNSLKTILNTYQLMFYDSLDELVTLIKGLLEIDPHSRYTKKKKLKMLYAFYIDKLNVIYEYNAANKEIIIQNIEYIEEYKKLRNKAWLEGYMDQLNIK
jgi:tRNA-Thr(GGU) m(6)t(6)A37 methyltransferase TsaA